MDLLDCVSNYACPSAVQGHAGSVVAIDWSLDSRLLQSCGSEQVSFDTVIGLF
jgi:hypothetical protein